VTYFRHPRGKTETGTEIIYLLVKTVHWVKLKKMALNRASLQASGLHNSSVFSGTP
jgi:hypothetical protein